MIFPKIERVILFGGAPALVGVARGLRSSNYEVFVFTSPRHATEVVDEERSLTLEQALDSLEIEWWSTEDINTEPALHPRITPHTVGIGLGEAWSFDQSVIDAFGGRLVDLMGIPLPQYRGGAHYTWMILRGDRRMGAHIQVINTDMVQGLWDSGEILFSTEYEPSPDARIPRDYFAAAVPKEVDFVLSFLERASAGHDFETRLPDESQSLYFPRIHTLTNGWVNWSWNGEAIERFICAFDAPYAGAGTRLNGDEVRLRGARLLSDAENFHPFQSGLVVRVESGVAFVATTSGLLEVEEVLRGGEKVNQTLIHGMRFHTPQAVLDEALQAQVRYGASTRS